MLIPVRGRSLPLATPALVAINLDELVGRLAAVLADCLAERATSARLEQVGRPV